MRKLLLCFITMMLVTAADARIYITGFMTTITDSERQFRPDDNPFGITGWQTIDFQINPGDLVIAKLAIGYEFNFGMRVEADVFTSALRNTFTTSYGNFNLGIESVRVLYDISTGTRFVPYFGAGIWNMKYMAERMENYSFSAILGLSVRLTDNMALDMQYERNWMRNDSHTIEVAPNVPLNGTLRNGRNFWKTGLRYYF